MVLGMIRILFKKMLDEKSFREKRKITLDEVATETGIGRATITRIANKPGYSTNTDTLNILCNYLGCGTDELLQFIEDSEEG